MWLRPRTEALPLNSRWWEFAQDPRDATAGMLLGLLNLALVALAVAGAVQGDVRPAGVMLVWIVLRSIFLEDASAAPEGISDVAVTAAGCAGFCDQEPLVDVEMRGEPAVRYGRVNADGARRIVREHIVSGKKVQGLALG